MCVRDRNGDDCRKSSKSLATFIYSSPFFSFHSHVMADVVPHVRFHKTASSQRLFVYSKFHSNLHTPHTAPIHGCMHACMSPLRTYDASANTINPGKIRWKIQSLVFILLTQMCTPLSRNVCNRNQSQNIHRMSWTIYWSVQDELIHEEKSLNLNDK